MRRALAAVVSAAAGIGIVLGLHGSRPSHPLASASGSQRHGASQVGTQKRRSSSGASQGGLRNGVAIGPKENYGYGVFAVEVIARSGRIVDLSVVGMEIAEPFSQSLAQRAIPILRNEVLRAQSANVATVSGATYTSDAYLSSIQAAIDRLRS